LQMWRQEAISLVFTLLWACGTRSGTVSEASLPKEDRAVAARAAAAEQPVDEAADLTLQGVAFVRLSEGRVSSRGTAHEMTYRRATGRLLASQGTLQVVPRTGSGLAALGTLHLTATRIDAETGARRGVGSQGVRLDSERGDHARTERVTYDGPADRVASDSPLFAQGTGYRVRSRGFVARADGSEVKLIGGVAGRVSEGAP
jgi:hypothetical protein